MAKKKSKKSKSQKRFDKLRKSELCDLFAVQDFSDIWSESDLPIEEWHREQMQNFTDFCELIYAKMLADTDSIVIDPFETRKKIWGLAQIAWNIASTTKSLADSIVEVAKIDNIFGPEGTFFEIKDAILIMLQMRWSLYPDCDSLVDDIEFTPQANGKHDVALTLKRVETI